MIVSSSVNLGTCRNDFVSAVGKAVTLTNDQTSSHQNVAERIKDLKVSYLGHYSGVLAHIYTDSACVIIM